MHFSLLLTITFMYLLTIALAAPLKSQRRSFKVLQKRRDFAAPRPAGSGVVAMSKAYRKYGFPTPESPDIPDTKVLALTDGDVDVPQSLAATGGGRTSSDVAANAQEGDSEFLSPITIGGQSVTMDFDTGSSDLCVTPLLFMINILEVG